MPQDKPRRRKAMTFLSTHFTTHGEHSVALGVRRGGPRVEPDAAIDARHVRPVSVLDVRRDAARALTVRGPPRRFRLTIH